jgi:hypothetical protein
MFSEDESKKPGCYLVSAVSALVFVVVVKLIWPTLIPFRFLEFVKLTGSVSDVLQTSWLLFVWGIVGTFGLRLVSGSSHLDHPKTWLTFQSLGALFAGISEEIAFRWLIFFSLIVSYQIVNWLIFGFAGFGVAEWTYLHFFGPITNWLSLGYLQPQLFSPLGWYVGAALMTSNLQFRDGHAFHGLIGWANSWFIGMFFFYLMFRYGLIAAMIAHTIYDLLIFLEIYLISLYDNKYTEAW